MYLSSSTSCLSVLEFLYIHQSTDRPISHTQDRKAIYHENWKISFRYCTEGQRIPNLLTHLVFRFAVHLRHHHGKWYGRFLRISPLLRYFSYVCFCNLTMFIWFLHNTFRSRYRNINPLWHFACKARIHKSAGCFLQGSRGNIWFLYNTPSFLLYKSSTGLLTPLPPRLRTWV